MKCRYYFKYIIYYLMITERLLMVVHSFHDADNVEYDCWPLGAQEGDPTVDCAGLGMVWPGEPPDTVEVSQKFNVTYNVFATDLFYQDRRLFPNKTEAELRDFCQLNNTCPENVADSAMDNCCVWHANIHTCHPTVNNEARVCGPWVANDGLLSTHTVSQNGIIGTIFFAQDVVIDFEGPNFIIAHVDVGNVQIAIGKSIFVTSRKVCGDGLCTANIGENCQSCPTDCCRLPFPVEATATIVTVAVFIPSIVAVIILIWYYIQKRKRFLDESWIINYEDIQKDTTDHRGILGSAISLKNLKYLTNNTETCDITSSDFTTGTRQIFTQTGFYEGRRVAIKKTARQDIILTNPIRTEVMQIRVLDHPNLCKFIGSTLKNPKNLYIINEYCPKGSLNDVLQNDDIPLNWGFRFSFASDIARGMAYLHSKKIYHNRLTSSNCTIDDRWVVKISDYGLPSFRETEELEDNPASTFVKIYYPPEIMGVEPALIVPAPATDVYSYSIILVEVATRMDPFSENLFLDISGKPAIDNSHLSASDSPCPCPEEYMDLIQRCWAFMPFTRPTFDQIKKHLARINPYKESPVDNMMIMMEKYSKHLETLVSERTQELIAEQNKTATLLYSMLPKPIADDLKQGEAAPATNFKSSTIFFSDIVGFTTLASLSTPLEIVRLLNSLYSMFDDILDQFDAYKVETIGDAYMVVSGVPQKNGDRHAREIASMALTILAACDKFVIPHFPNKKLEIRVGIHSGPVCAGVVGLKMPRYCLFGDTVNTASRMESASEAMRIHCSDVTYQLLKMTGTFRFQSRGSITVKGKGSMVTWWLLGLDERRDSLTGITLTEKVSPIKVRRSNTRTHMGSTKAKITLNRNRSFSASPTDYSAIRRDRAFSDTPIIPNTSSESVTASFI